MRGGFAEIAEFARRIDQAATEGMIGGALGAVSTSDPQPVAGANSSIMNPMIGGQAMLPGRDIMENLSASPMHSRLAAAMTESGVGAALKADGQFTVFAPTNAAFAAAGLQAKSTLARRMSYLIVPGKYDSAALLRAISEAGGEARLRTAEGGILVARMNGPTNIAIMDEKGTTANIAIYDVRDRNGIVHVVDNMIAPSGPARQVALN